MRIKLLDPAYANFTGKLGPIDFTDGVSDYGVAPQQAESLLLTIHGEMISSPEEAEIQAELTKAKADLTKAQKDLTDLQAEFDAYKAANPAK